MDTLRYKARAVANREPSPSAGCIDSQTVKGTDVGGEAGQDGGKKLRGRKQHIIVDTQGLLLVVVITAASTDNGATALEVLGRLTAENRSRLELMRDDSQWNNRELDRGLVTSQVGYAIEVIEQPPGAMGFVKLLAAGSWK